MKITKQWLVAAYACPSQVEIFDEEWPDGAEITLENYLLAVKLDLNVNWLLKRIFSAPAQEAYIKAIAQALEAYDKVVPAASKGYNRAMAASREAYHRVMAEALEAYNITAGTAFIAIYKKYGAEKIKKGGGKLE